MHYRESLSVVCDHYQKEGKIGVCKSLILNSNP